MGSSEWTLNIVRPMTSKQFSLCSEIIFCAYYIELWFIFHFSPHFCWNLIKNYWPLYFWNVIKKVSTNNFISVILSRRSSLTSQTLKNCQFFQTHYNFKIAQKKRKKSMDVCKNMSFWQNCQKNLRIRFNKMKVLRDSVWQMKWCQCAAVRFTLY